MAGKRKEVRATVVGRLVVEKLEDRARLLLLMRMFREAVEMAHYLKRRGVDDNEVQRRVTRFLSNKWYAVSAIKKARLYCNQPYLKLRRPTLFSVGAKAEKGNRNIRLVATNKVLIKIPSADGRHRWIEARVTFGREYLRLVRELVDGNYSYGVSVSVREKVRKISFRIYLHVSLELYVKYIGKRIGVKQAGHIAGFDLNSDRVNMVIIDRRGVIRDVKTKRFPEVTSPGYPRDKAVNVRRTAVAELVKYARYHGVKYFVIEKLSRFKPKGSKKAKRKQSKTALGEFSRQMEVLVPKVSGELVKVNPAYSSVSARLIAEDLGLDVHTTAAYIIALRGLRKIQKDIS